MIRPFSCIAGEGGERSEPDEARKRHCGVASGTPLTLPALTRRAPPSPAVQERG